MTEIERAYAMVHMNRACSILGGFGYGNMAVGGGQPPALTDADRQEFLLEVERAKAWVMGERTVGPQIVAMRGGS